MKLKEALEKAKKKYKYNIGLDKSKKKKPKSRYEKYKENTGNINGTTGIKSMHIIVSITGKTVTKYENGGIKSINLTTNSINGIIKRIENDSVNITRNIMQPTRNG